MHALSPMDKDNLYSICFRIHTKIRPREPRDRRCVKNRRQVGFCSKFLPNCFCQPNDSSSAGLKMSLPELSRSTLLSCSLADEGVCMCMPDGKTFLVDRATAERSETLSAYLMPENGSTFTIPVSEDLLYAWLALVDVLDISDVHTRMCSMPDEEVSLYLKVSGSPDA